MAKKGLTNQKKTESINKQFAFNNLTDKNRSESTATYQQLSNVEPFGWLQPMALIMVIACYGNVIPIEQNTFVDQ